MEGLSGQAAAQRSVVSEHRSEEAAREDARVERNRLEVIYGEAASDWRVVVLRDDEVVWEERPKGTVGPRLAPTPLEPPPMPAGDEDAAAPVPRRGPDAPDSAEPASEEPAAEDTEPETSGPVPDWLIARVEESIARSQQRERERKQGD